MDLSLSLSLIAAGTVPDLGSCTGLWKGVVAVLIVSALLAFQPSAFNRYSKMLQHLDWVPLVFAVTMVIGRRVSPCVATLVQHVAMCGLSFSVLRPSRLHITD